MKALYLLLLSVCFSFFAKATTDFDATFQQAKQLYDQSLYEEAEEQYQSIINAGVQDASVHFNLANTYYKLEAVAPAILHYEKALKLDPNNEKYAFNLSLANQRKIDQIEALPKFWLSSFIQNISGSFHSDTWAMLIHLVLFLSLVAWAIFLFTKTMVIKKASLFIGLITFISTFLAYGLGDAQYEKDLHPQAAIIFSPNVYIKTAPSEKSDDAFILHEGTKVKLLDRVNEWVNIQLIDGKIGWINQSELQEI